MAYFLSNQSIVDVIAVVVIGVSNCRSGLDFSLLLPHTYKNHVVCHDILNKGATTQAKGYPSSLKSQILPPPPPIITTLFSSHGESKS